MQTQEKVPGADKSQNYRGYRIVHNILRGEFYVKHGEHLIGAAQTHLPAAKYVIDELHSRAWAESDLPKPHVAPSAGRIVAIGAESSSGDRSNG